MKTTFKIFRLLFCLILSCCLFETAQAQVKPIETVIGAGPSASIKIEKKERGKKQYEHKNHLYNTMAVVSDRKLQVSSTPGLTTQYKADVNVSNDYYGFGMEMAERNQSRKNYRYGFQGQEKDDEIKGSGNAVNYKYRMHDPRLGRFFAVDPLTARYAYYSPYQFSGNRVMDMIELEGLEPTESGSYGGEGAIAAEVKDGKEVEGTADQRWTWEDSKWNKVDFNVTNSELTAIFAKGKSASLKQIEIQVNLNGSDYGITTKKSLAHFLSQAGHEVGGFSKGLGIEENLNYSVDGLIGTFGKYFYKGTAVKGKSNADSYGRKKGQAAKKSDIANIVYANRMGNGDTKSGEGYKYRGRGIFQLTGKNNYKAFNDFANVTNKSFIDKPELILETEYSIMSAMWFYKVNVVDKLKIESATVKEVTKKVNGGSNGLTDRTEIYDKAIKELK